jgi:UDP-N-acetylglucosamine 2-epimerase (non-hydrolysing)/GDP/UDP-N,N'-diacetylbacillosamine 2-epimerase (hydrolysing)
VTGARRKVCIVTGSRADYGLFFWLMRGIGGVKGVGGDPDLQLQVIATGMHLSPEFGLTYRQIEEDDFQIDAKVEMLLSGDTPVAIAKSIGLGVIGFAEALESLKPDILVLLGDRFEILAAAQSALILRIPIAHIHGGETSEGVYDESIRHAITKMAQWHFVAAEPYRKRVEQMGEPPERIFNYGAPGLDRIARLQWLSRQELEAALEVRLGAPFFLVVYHPVTLAEEKPEALMAEVLAALEQFPQATVIFTYPNADTGGRALMTSIDRFVAQHRGQAWAFASLGQQRYLSLMRECDVVIGNSSSGLIETPVLKKATVNIGDRQKGRLKATSVIDSAENREAIARAIRTALSEEFRRRLPDTVSLYGEADASLKIQAKLKSVVLGVRKSFFDIEQSK